MSEEHLEIVSDVLTRFGEGDWEEERWDEEVVVTPPRGWPEGGAIQGREAWRRQVDRLRDSWETARVEIDEMHPVSNDRVVTRFRYITRGEGELSFDREMGSIHTLRDRTIVRVDFFASADDAFRAAGIGE